MSRGTLIGITGQGSVRRRRWLRDRLRSRLHKQGGRMTNKRIRTKHAESLEARLAEEARRLRHEARGTPPGIARDVLLRKARQAETGAQMSEWLRSPGLQPPE